MSTSLTSNLDIRDGLLDAYGDVLTAGVRDALEALAHFDDDRRELMTARIVRRSRRSRDREPIDFLDPAGTIGHTSLTVQDTRDGRFEGSEIPRDLQRQWIQGTGPGA